LLANAWVINSSVTGPTLSSERRPHQAGSHIRRSADNQSTHGVAPINTNEHAPQPVRPDNKNNRAPFGKSNWSYRNDNLCSEPEQQPRRGCERRKSADPQSRVAPDAVDHGLLPVRLLRPHQHQLRQVPAADRPGLERHRLWPGREPVRDRLRAVRSAEQHHAVQSRRTPLDRPDHDFLGCRPP